MGRLLNWALTGIMLLLGGVVLFFHVMPQSDPLSAEPIVIRQGEIRLVECDHPTRILRDWQSVRLPYWEEQSEAVLKCFQFRSIFDSDRSGYATGPYKLFLYNIGSISHIHLNGRLLDELRHSDKSTALAAHGPYEIYLPPDLRQDRTEIFYEAVTTSPFIHLGVSVIGPDPVLTTIYHATGFLVGTILDGVKILSLMLGVMFLSFSILFPQERLIGLAGGTMLSWGLYYGLLTLIEYPVDLNGVILSAQYCVASLFCFFIIDFVVEVAGLRKSGLHVPFRFILFLSGPFALSVFAQGKAVVWLNLILLVLLIFYFLFMLFRSIQFGDLLKNLDRRLFKIQILFILFLVLHDYCVLNGYMGYIRSYFSSPTLPDLVFENYLLTFYGILPIIFTMLEIVINRYRFNRHYMQNETVRVASALRQSEVRLREVIQKQHDIRNIKLIQQERERLLMEIHDGVGSQLIAGMLLAKKEGLQKKAVLEMIQGCIDDVRVIIDCISLAERADPLEVFGKLLNRQKPRLAGLGITLHYRPETRFAQQNEISDAQCLHASRIIQECIANAIKHATCREIVVAIRQYREHLLVLVKDDGGGVAKPELLNFGWGLKNMRKRTRLLGGRIKFQNYGNGFAVTLRFRNRPVDEGETDGRMLAQAGDLAAIRLDGRGA